MGRRRWEDGEDEARYCWRSQSAVCPLVQSTSHVTPRSSRHTTRRPLASAILREASMLHSLAPLRSALLAVSLFWAFVHLAHCLALALVPARRSSSSLLPSHARAHSPRPPRLFAHAHTQVTLRVCTLRVHTTALNAPHDALAAALHTVPRRGALVRLYDAGSVLGVLGMLGALALLSYTALRLWADVPGGSSMDARGVVKRGLNAGGDEGGSGLSPGDGVPVQLIIPGITVPLSHLPLLLLALLFSQVIHEAGHALTAALDALPLLSAGVALTLVFPSAFVALPSAALRALPPPARLRVVSAGALHNLLLYLLLALLASAGAPGALWRAAGYTDTRAWGRVIARVAQDSPLRAHLPPGAVVTRLDDTSLATGGGTADVWTSYLSSAPESSLQDHALGWCVDRAWFIDQPTSCCASLGSSPAPLFCFTSPPAALSEPFDLERCIDPLPLLSASSPVAGASVQRCHAPVDCGSARLCTRPRADQELLRLALHLPAWLRDEGEQAEEKVVLWGGPREEVLEEVEVSTWLPRHRFLPVRLPVLVGAFFAYLQMLNLSLYLFNLIPLPFLDGAQLLDAALDLALSWRASRSTDVELDSLEGGHAPAPHAHTPGARFVLWKHRVLRAAHAFAGMLIGLCVLLGALTAIR
ncbi:hypothetical protein AcW1_010198 [Taiwanofungus camphoratus]|nr:hypothetical protein AcW1_010198 [Antrodia cinnamomea]